ncbi:MAG: uracil-DNA glycosylase family protein [Planctomycetota bacterium]
MGVLAAAFELERSVARLRFRGPAAYTYSPLTYALDVHAAYLRRFGKGKRDVILLGMNPGPWGMVQTGVPFGEVGAVRDWMKLEGRIEQPKRQHPKVPVLGFDCPRSEVSGARLWGWARDCFGTPRQFFRRFFVWNYCPLAFLEECGRNLTPDKLPKNERVPLEEACNEALRRIVATMKPEHVVGVGSYAAKRAGVALCDLPLRIGQILHPSPASPAANRGWAEKITVQLADMGIEVPRHG